MANDRPRQTKRLEFHSILESLPGVVKAWYQRPPKNNMNLDNCILYTGKPGIRYADNHAYLKGTYYTVTFIHSDPDSETVDAILGLQYCSFDRHFISDDLHHDVFNIFFK